MEFKEAMRIWARMCNSVGPCGSCTLPATSPNECATWVMTNTRSAEDFFEKWAAEHPERTIADDFFAKHPKAKKNKDDFPLVCAVHCGYIDKCPDDYSELECKRCWRRPLEEVEG